MEIVCMYLLIYEHSSGSYESVSVSIVTSMASGKAPGIDKIVCLLSCHR